MNVLLMLSIMGYIYFLTTFSSVGVILNLISLFVFYRHSFKLNIGHHTWTYLTSLAVADTITCLIFICFGPLKCLHHKDSILQEAWNVYKTYFFWPLCYTFGTVSVWITMVVSVDRCLYVTSYGLKHRGFFKHSKLTVVIIFLVSALFHVPHWLIYDPEIVSETNDYVLSDFLKTTFYTIWSYCRIVFGKLVPIIAVVISNIVLIKVTWLSKAWNKKSVTVAAVFRLRAQNKMTAMLICISFMFVVCHFIEAVVYVLVNQEDITTYFDNGEHYSALIVAVMTMEAISFASNFIFYCICNRVFADSIRNMFRCQELQGSVKSLNAVGLFPEPKSKVESLSEVRPPVFG